MSHPSLLGDLLYRNETVISILKPGSTYLFSYDKKKWYKWLLKNDSLWEGSGYGFSDLTMVPIVPACVG